MRGLTATSLAAWLVFAAVLPAPADDRHLLEWNRDNYILRGLFYDPARYERCDRTYSFDSRERPHYW